MKKRHAITQNIKSFVAMINSSEITFDLPIQRTKGQWTLDTQSLLIHSIIKDYDIPAVYSKSDRTAGEHEFRYSIIDGLQRLSTLVEFCNDKLTLHKDTPNVTLSGVTYDIEGLKFSELDDVLKNAINDYQLTMYYFIDMQEEELIEMFCRIGNGKSLNNQQKAKARLGLQMATSLNSITSLPFFRDYTKLTPAQIKKADDEKIVMRVLMAMDEDFRDELAYDNKTMERYMTVLRTSNNTDLFEELTIVLEYLTDAIESVGFDKLDVLKNRYLAYMMLNARYAYMSNVSSQQYGAWMLEVSKRLDNEGYKALFAQTAANKSNSGVKDIQKRLEESLDANALAITQV